MVEVREHESERDEKEKVRELGTATLRIIATVPSDGRPARHMQYQAERADPR